MTESLSVLALQKGGSVYAWAETAGIRAKAEVQPVKNLFSTIGVGAKSIRFTVWEQSLTLHNAFRWHGNFCFLTDINETPDRLCYEVQAFGSTR